MPDYTFIKKNDIAPFFSGDRRQVENAPGDTGGGRMLV
jgi:DUF438 domain-containing protein